MLLVLRQALNIENSSYIYAEMGFDLWQLLVIHYKRPLNQDYQCLFN